VCVLCLKILKRSCPVMQHAEVRDIQQIRCLRFSLDFSSPGSFQPQQSSECVPPTDMEILRTQLGGVHLAYHAPRGFNMRRHRTCGYWRIRPSLKQDNMESSRYGFQTTRLMIMMMMGRFLTADVISYEDNIGLSPDASDVDHCWVYEKHTMSGRFVQVTS